MIYRCKWILLQALHMSGLQFIMQSMTACILSLSFSYILKLISLMNFDGSFPSPVWNMQCFSTDHFRTGCQVPADHRPAAALPCFPHLPTQGCCPRHTEGTVLVPLGKPDLTAIVVGLWPLLLWPGRARSWAAIAGSPTWSTSLA